MAKLFEENGFTVSPNVLPAAGYTPFRDMGWNRDAIRSDEAVKKAEKILGDDVPALPATLYMQFYRIGNRAKIGAGCVVACDVPDGATVVMDKPRILLKKE